MPKLNQNSLSDSFQEYNKLLPDDFSTLDEFIEQWRMDAREVFCESDQICPHCKMPEDICICSQYDSEGNEL